MTVPSIRPGSRPWRKSGTRQREKGDATRMSRPSSSRSTSMRKPPPAIAISSSTGRTASAAAEGVTCLSTQGGLVSCRRNRRFSLSRHHRIVCRIRCRVRCCCPNFEIMQHVHRDGPVALEIASADYGGACHRAAPCADPLGSNALAFAQRPSAALCRRSSRVVRDWLGLCLSPIRWPQIFSPRT
jgi:hypothetical protein